MSEASLLKMRLFDVAKYCFSNNYVDATSLSDNSVMQNAAKRSEESLLIMRLFEAAKHCNLIGYVDAASLSDNADCGNPD